MKGIRYGIISGSCGAAASLFGKACGLPIFEGLIIIKAVLFALMIISNAGVWTFFVKALQFSESSLSATVISASSNYLLSALIGYFLLGEITTLIWWSGLSLILVGLFFITRDQRENTAIKISAEEEDKKKR